MNTRLVMAAAVLIGAIAQPALAQQPETRAAHATDAAGEAVTDAWITTKVKTDLLATKDVAGTAINVDTKDGVVTLSGTVKSKTEADKAISVARSVKGVTSVTSNLKVTGHKT